jgi:hypothetical protein
MLNFSLFVCCLLCIDSVDSCTFSGSNHIGGAGAERREAGVTRGGIGEEPGGGLVAGVIGDIHKFSGEVLWFCRTTMISLSRAPPLMPIRLLLQEQHCSCQSPFSVKSSSAPAGSKYKNQILLHLILAY